VASDNAGYGDSQKDTLTAMTMTSHLKAMHTNKQEAITARETRKQHTRSSVMPSQV
jgi:hypothetical protein